MRTTSNRELARQIGVSETAVRRAEKSGRIRREADGAWDLARVKAAWAGNTDQAQQRRQHAATRPVSLDQHQVHTVLERHVRSHRKRCSQATGWAWA